MAYDTWSWDKDTGTGGPTGFDMDRLSEQLVNENDAGYNFTEPLNTKDRWIFTISFSIIRPQGMVYLTDFFHSHRGGAPFYFRAPWGFYGRPEYLYTADPGGVSPWSSEIEPGFGDSPTWKVYFKSTRLPFSRHQTKNNYWYLREPIELVTI